MTRKVRIWMRRHRKPYSARVNPSLFIDLRRRDCETEENGDRSNLRLVEKVAWFATPRD